MEKATCAVPDCDRPTKARGWCITHWGRWHRLGDVQADVPIRSKNMTPEPLCVIEGCERDHFARGFCRSHYSRWQRYGDDMDRAPIVEYLPKDVPCQVGDCAEDAIRCGMCWRHYYRQLRTGSTDLRALAPEEIAAKAEARRAYLRDWKRRQYQADPEAARAQHKAWKQANPERAKLHDARKRRRRRGAPAIPFTVDQLQQRLAYWGNRCWMCGVPAEAVDHVKPLARGGWHALMNLRPICTPCNSRKRDRWPL